MQYLVHSVVVVIVVVVCVQSVHSKGGSLVSREMSVGKRQRSPLLVFIYMYVFCSESVPKCGQLVVRNLFWLQSKFFFFCCYLMNLTEFEPKTGLKRNVVVCCYCCSVYRCGGDSSLFQRKRNIFNKRCCCFAVVSYFAIVVIAFLYRCCCSVNICCWKIPVFNLECR